MKYIEVLETQTLIEKDREVESIESQEESTLIETDSDQVLIDGEGHTEIIEAEMPALIETAATQGLRGARGPMGPMGEVKVSDEDKNRLTRKQDGLYVSDDLKPDPLAYYILAKG